MKRLDSSDKNFAKRFDDLRNRSASDGASLKVNAVVSGIINDVREHGDKALFAYTQKFDSLKLTAGKIRITESEFEKAEKDVSPKLKRAIKKAFGNIKKFHMNQREQGFIVKTGKSSKVGQMVTPLERVGLYVPGGTASYPSSVLMNAIPAMVAGVKDIIICSPTPKGKINQAVLYVASLCGVADFYRVGGAQAVAAMAFGTKSIKRVDKITGPGNAYVAEAKRQVFGQVDIDMVAGPSEVCIVADNSANPEWIASDILAQAEHDASAVPILMTSSNRQIKSVLKELETQLDQLERNKIAKKCLDNNFYAIKTKSISEAVELANRLAPEHLELFFKNANSALKKVKSAGAVFIGGYSPEVLGDYMAGPNHVLPTAGSARFFSPLGVYDFTKRTSVIDYSKTDFELVAKSVAEIANAEGLTAHARSALIRLKK